MTAAKKEDLEKDSRPVQEEPSVLDYLKSRLKFWERGEKIEIPPEAAPGVPGAASGRKVRIAPAQAVEKESKAAPAAPPEPPNRWPWRSLLALAFALLGQRAFEPSPTRTATAGLVFYAIGLAWLVLAYLKREWRLTPLPEDGSKSDALQARRLPLALAIPVTLAAFLSLGGNLFTWFNVSLWLLAIALFVTAFWVRDPAAEPWWDRLKGFLSRPEWKITVTRGALLVLLASGLVIFYRVYRVNAVPAEPFSDHAEKLLDVYDVSQGETHIFFPRNTGREAIQMYLTLVISWIFGTGLSFLSLKIGTVICGLATLPYIYLLGKEFGGKRTALLALLFAGIAYWPNVISRVGLRFPLYPLFVAPVLYYLIRGLRLRSRNDFILSGLFLGFGLHGYSPSRIIPFVVVIAVGLYLLHAQSKGNRKQVVVWLAILALVSFVVFLPLARYWLENPDAFNYRALSRLGTLETELPAPAWKVFLSNTWNALRMFNWDDGEIWVHSVPHRPALDVVSGALFIIGVLLVLIRYIRRHHWLDLFLLLSVPLLQLPSIASLAYPGENPALNRAGGALVPTFLIVAVGLDGLFAGIKSRMRRRAAGFLTWGLALVLVLAASLQNYNLVFDQYAVQFKGGAWNSSQMGAVIKQFGETYGTTDSVWIVPYPYWVDTRLPGIWAGIPNRDFALWPEQLEQSVPVPGPKLFLFKPEDEQAQATLQALYPQGVLSRYTSDVEGHDFMMYFVPPDR